MASEPKPSPELATVKRVPRYGVFIALGALLGAVGALVITMIGFTGGRSVTGVSYSFGQVLGFGMLYMIPIGIALGTAVAVILEWIARRKDRVVQVQHERILVEPEHPNATS